MKEIEAKAWQLLEGNFEGTKKQKLIVAIGMLYILRNYYKKIKTTL
jgi:hypothetical protein